MHAGSGAYFSAVNSRSPHLPCKRAHGHGLRLSRQLDSVLSGSGTGRLLQDAPKFLSPTSHAARRPPFLSRFLLFRPSGTRRARAEGEAAASLVPQARRGANPSSNSSPSRPPCLPPTARFARCLQRKLFTGCSRRQSRWWFPLTKRTRRIVSDAARQMDFREKGQAGSENTAQGVSRSNMYPNSRPALSRGRFPARPGGRSPPPARAGDRGTSHHRSTLRPWDISSRRHRT